MEIAPALEPKMVTYPRRHEKQLHGAATKHITHFVRVPAKSADMLLDPVQRGQLILQTQVQCTPFRCLCPLWKAKRANSVTKVDIHDRSTL